MTQPKVTVGKYLLLSIVSLFVLYVAYTGTKFSSSLKASKFGSPVIIKKSPFSHSALLITGSQITGVVQLVTARETHLRCTKTEQDNSHCSPTILDLNFSKKALCLKSKFGEEYGWRQQVTEPKATEKEMHSSSSNINNMSI